jgi:peroxiredoxin
VKRERGWTLGELSRPELSELRRLTIGKPAPSMAGEDLDGQAIRLSDYRRKVVVLLFWSTSCFDSKEIKRYRELLDRNRGRGLEFVGIYMDDGLERAKELVQQVEVA